MKPCAKCGQRPRLPGNNSYCRECRDAKNRAYPRRGYDYRSNAALSKLATRPKEKP